MLNSLNTAPAAQQGPALLRDIDALVSGWDTSRSAADLIAAITDRLQSEPQADETATSNEKKKRGKCMSRRPGQDGSKEYIEGGCYKFRLWVDVPGGRKHPGIEICPVKGPGALNKSQREARKRELIAEHTGKNKESVESEGAVTFEQQAKIHLGLVGNRNREPVVDDTLGGYERIMRLYLNPVIGKYPLSKIFSPQLKLVVDSMVKKGLSASWIDQTIVLAKAVVGSATDPQTGEVLYPRKWKADIIDLPVIDPDEQNTPAFSRDILTGVRARAKIVHVAPRERCGVAE
jgi:hypothetical protein